MKRLRLVALGTTVVLLAALALMGGGYLRSAGTAHADAADGKAIGKISLDALTHSPLGHEENLSALKHVNGHIAQGIPNIDSVPNFSGKYHADGVDQNGTPNKQWVYNTVGTLPQHGGTTTIRVPIIPISLDLLAPDGSLLIHDDATPDAQPTLNSPLFQECHLLQQQHAHPVQRRRPACRVCQQRQERLAHDPATGRGAGGDHRNSLGRLRRRPVHLRTQSWADRVCAA